MARSETTHPHVHNVTNRNLPDISKPVTGHMYGQARSSTVPSFLSSSGLYSGLGVKFNSLKSYNQA